MIFEEVNIALNAFGRYVIQQSRSNLTRGKKNVTKGLYNSLKYKVYEDDKNNFILDFLGADYQDFVDEGVRGKNPNALPKGAKNFGKQQAPNSPFKFGSGRGGSGLRRAINKWVTQKKAFGGQIRDKKGRFIPRKTLQFLITRSIWYSGIKPSMFFTKPFTKAFKRLPAELLEAFKIDVEKGILLGIKK